MYTLPGLGGFSYEGYDQCCILWLLLLLFWRQKVIAICAALFPGTEKVFSNAARIAVRRYFIWEMIL